MTSSTQSALYVVATPVGNLEDITLRALRILKEVAIIACEDTRQTQKLLNHYDISTPSISYHEHNEATRSAELIHRIENGESVALVSDAGTPGISDPGYRLITLAIRHQVPVVPVPGASAFLSALVASGLPTDAVAFSGFLPAKRGQRRTDLEAIKASQRTHVFYEAPHRIIESLEDIVEVLGGDRRVVVAREVTKLHEEFIRGRAADVFEQMRHQEPRGEITLLIAKAEPQTGPIAEKRADLPSRLQEIMASQQLDEKSALKVLAREQGVSKSEVYRELQRQRTKGNPLSR
ncbi:MAG TPA: 16S rRNA (cytidine(1402)-2'-O)-methyltransferase [Terriglobales bacterium]|nr:16S rRNA (cytidine(1402)-2'-O)-methyltransferase [Terriglobales bacterium]